MTALQLDLTDEQRHWLKCLAQSRRKPEDATPDVPEHIVEALAEKNLLYFRRGLVEITFAGIAEMYCRQL